MNRYGRGWHGDSYRHYLAGKGVATARFTKQNRYFAEEKEGFMDKHKMTAVANNPESETEFRQQVVDDAKAEILGKLRAKVDAGEMHSSAVGKELDQFEAESRPFMQDGNVELFRDNTRRKFGYLDEEHKGFMGI